MEVWHWKCDVLEYEDNENVSEYAIWFKKIYKRVDPYKNTPSRTIIRKFINSLPSKFMKLLMIIGSPNLDEVIEAALDVEASQKVKARKRDQAYIVDTIEKLQQEVHNL